MSYKTVEVELENGRVKSANGEALPAKARALLTILSPRELKADESEGPSLADLTAEFAGIGQGKYTDLSTNKAHLEGFGR